jgi:hypothetical protein
LNKFTRSFLTISFVFLLYWVGNAQQETPGAKKPPAVNPPVSPLKSSAAYAEVLLRKTEIEADLESMLVDFTEEYPKVKEARLEFGLIQKEIDRLAAVKPADAGKLSAALGKLMVQKVTLETDLAILRGNHDDKHPDVISAKKKVDIFEKAIRDILGQ